MQGRAIGEIGVGGSGLRVVRLLVQESRYESFHAGPAEVGLLVASNRLPFPILGLFAGAIVDRVRKRTL